MRNVVTARSQHENQRERPFHLRAAFLAWRIAANNID
jgi:hypothetical protein